MRIKSIVMKKIAVLFAAAVAMTTGALHAAADTDPDFSVKTSVPPKILFIGDSITAGYGLDGFSEDKNTDCASFANILSKVFSSELPPEADFHMKNMGISGLTSNALKNKLKDGYYDSELREADAVVISIGGNDLLWVLLHIVDSENSFSEVIKQLVSMESQMDENLDKFSDNLTEITDEIFDRNQSGDFQLFFQTLYNPFENYSISALDELAQDKIGRLNEIIYEHSEGGNLYTVADVAADFKGECAELTNIDYLDIHPNADGHARIAKLLQPVIESKTYTYYDREAEMQYAIDAENARQESERRKKMTAAGCAAASGAAVVGAVVFGAVKSIKSKKAKKE